MPIIEWPALYDQITRYLSGAARVLGVWIDSSGPPAPPVVDLTGPIARLRSDAGPRRLRTDAWPVRLMADAGPIGLLTETGPIRLPVKR